MKNYTWKSTLSKHFQTYISIQRTAGFKFVAQERVLQHFDHYHFYNGYQGTRLTRDMVSGFIYNRSEAASTWRNKEIVMHGFGLYMRDSGYQAYIAEIKTELPGSRYIPHIYTKSELDRFFKAVDKYPHTMNSARNTVDPVLFRFLYGTGARLSEALDLKISDFDDKEGIVIIRQAKNNNDRIVPLHPSLATRIAAYLKCFHSDHSRDIHLFPSSLLTRMDASTAYRHFRDYLLMADIPHTGHGPRIHDFRHGLAVENLRRWSAEGRDLLNLLPYLSAYMGHSDFRATQYYLRLTAEIYPEMMETMEAACMDIIPEGVYSNEES